MICYKNITYKTQSPWSDRYLFGHSSFSMYTLSSSYKTSHQESQGFHLFHSLRAAPFGRGGPGLQVFLWRHSFHWYQEFLEIPGVQSFPGYPGHLWLLHGHHDHHDLVPQETQACRAYQGYHRNIKQEVAGLEWKKGLNYSGFTIMNFNAVFYQSLVHRVFAIWISNSEAILKEQYFTTFNNYSPKAKWTLVNIHFWKLY